MTPLQTVLIGMHLLSAHRNQSSGQSKFLQLFSSSSELSPQSFSPSHIQLGRAHTLVETHLNAYGGQVTFRGQGSGCSSSDACPSLQSMVPSQTSSIARQALLLAQANVSSGQGGYTQSYSSDPSRHCFSRSHLAALVIQRPESHRNSVLSSHLTSEHISGSSSEASPQSLSPSHTSDSGRQLPFLHRK